MEDHVCSPEKYSMKIHIIKIYFTSKKKNIYDKNVS